jgi:gliding motility-associated-like protein
VICANGNTGSASVNAIGGTAGYTYQWSTSPVQTSAVATGLTAGNYNVTVTDANGCSLTTVVGIIEPAPVAININSLSYFGGYNVSCNGVNDGAIDISVFGGIGGYTYSWSNGANSQDINNIMAGLYSVTATDANGCTAVMSVSLLEPPKLNATVDELIAAKCNGNPDGSIFVSVSGGVAGYTYSWNNGLITKDITGIGAGTYVLNVVDQNGCVTSISATITEPAPILTSYMVSNPTCNGMNDGNVTAFASGGLAPYTYNWSNGASGATNMNLGGGSYMVSVKDANGCINEVVIDVKEPAALALTRDVKSVKCSRDSSGAIDCSVDGGTSPYSFTWSTGSTSEDLNSLKAGTYFVTVTDAHGCIVKDEIALREPDPLVVNLSSPVQYNGYNISMYNGTDGLINVTVAGGVNPYSYFWENNSLAQNQYNLSAGGYSVTCTDANGCRTAANITLTQPLDLEMPTGFSPNNDGKNDNFIVHGIEAYPSNYLTVFNRWGNIVYQTAMYNNNWNGTNADGQALPDATYFVLLEVNGQEKVLKGYVEIRR